MIVWMPAVVESFPSLCPFLDLFEKENIDERALDLMDGVVIFVDGLFMYKQFGVAVTVDLCEKQLHANKFMIGKTLFIYVNMQFK